MCYKSEIIKKFTNINAIKYINQLETAVVTESNRKIFTNTIARYCCENQSIRLTGPPVFFVKVLFAQLLHMYGHD